MSNQRIDPKHDPVCGCAGRTGGGHPGMLHLIDMLERREEEKRLAALEDMAYRSLRDVRGPDGKKG